MDEKKNYIIFFLVLIHISITTISNALVAIPISFFGFKITWAAFVFPLVVVATDLTVRLLGKKIAQKTITLSYPFAIVSSILIIYFEGDFVSVSLRIGLASASAYALGMFIDIQAFQWIREKYPYWWLPPALSTVFSNIIDSYVFFFAAFFFLLRFLFFFVDFSFSSTRLGGVSLGTLSLVIFFVNWPISSIFELT